MPDARPAVLSDPAALPRHVAGTVVTVGTFDGVHRGHRDVLRRLHARAEGRGLHSVLVTFDPHPAEVLRPEAAPRLLTVGDEKIEALAPAGIDFCLILRFTRELAALDAEQFVDRILRPRLRMRELLVGHDHGFGRDRAGSVDVLVAMGERLGFPVEVVGPVRLEDGSPISSSRIRDAVAAGDLDGATAALGRPYSVSGTVERGAGRGRDLGYPTVNLGAPPARKLLPPEGVYAVRAKTPGGPFGGMMNLGSRPTFGDSAVSLEAHLFDAAGDLYGATVRIDFVARLRDVRRFSGPDELREQLARDEADARRILAIAPAGNLAGER